MSEENFTPGPWRRGFKNIGHVTAENGAVIAKCERLTSLYNMQANARLIAAAPDMYAALVDFIEYERLMDADEHVAGMCKYDDLREKAVKALAKALGEA
ncbi:hypothetical protein [Komagataeibacter europaeus]|uniref:hypothetical protein n=1 Tax=Komagataeibacter europaeus TaxID=33995 RepID=UPI0012DD7E36|nr:hypothetical protein [Komagataeibacter europaeus]